MSNKKQTAVEFLEQTFLKRMQEVYFISKYDLKLFEQAKAMEKEQIENAFLTAYLIGEDDIELNDAKISSRYYYQKTYEK